MSDIDGAHRPIPTDRITDLAAIDLTGTLMERLDIRLEHVSAQECTATMAVAGNVQPFGLLHGGASAALAETVASMAAVAHAGAGRTVVGLELSISHHRAARSGRVRARAQAVHLGRTTASYLVEITDEADRRISSARLTCLLLEGSSSPGAAVGAELSPGTAAEASA